MIPRNLKPGLFAIGLIASAPMVVHAANIVETAKTDGHFKMMLKAGEQAGVATWLQSPGPITVFAPNDDAFGKVPKAMLDELMKPANATMLKVTMGNHAVAGLVTVDAIDKGLTKAPAVAIPAMSGMPLVIKREDGVLTVNGAHVIKGPMKVDNGIVYVVDTVLLPAMPIQPQL